MAAADLTTIAKINYYMREHYFQHMQQVVLECIKKYGADPVLVFWKAVGEIMEDRIGEGMRSLQTIKDKRDVVLCSSMALVYAHKRCSAVDKEAVRELETRIKQERQRCGEKALYFAGLFLWHSGRHDKAREYVDRMLKISPGSLEGLVLRGWVDLTCNRESYMKKSGKYFDEVLGSVELPKPLDALLGKAKFLETKHNYSGALEFANQAVVSYPGLVPALIEKMKLQLSLQDWEQCAETANRILGYDAQSIEAIRMLILVMLCQDGHHGDAATKLGELIELVDRFEPKNHFLYFSLSKSFCRVAGRHGLVLQQTQALVERALALAPANAVYATELGYELLLKERVKEAMKAYRNAMKLDETSVAALTGVINCQLLEGQLEDAEQQLDFLNEIQSTSSQSAELKYLSAFLAKRKGRAAETVVPLLNEAINVHFSSLKGIALSEKYFEKMNPDFLLLIVRDYLSFASKEVSLPGQPPSDVLSRCIGILSPLTAGAPGIMEGMYFLAKVKFYSGNIEGAQETTQLCLKRDATYSDAHLLAAEIHLHQGNFKQASQSLEVGLSYNFEVRENPTYHLVKAKILHATGKLEEAARVLNTALNIPGVRKPIVGQKGSSKAMAGLGNRVSVFLELAAIYRKLDQKHEAAKVMQDAINEFQGTPEETKVTIANALLDLDRGDTEHALNVLRRITPDKPHYTQAVEKMAHIYLHQRKDRRRYAACFQELANKRPEPRSFLLLGDAFMNIQEPEKAIEVYESALKKNPRDGALAKKIGKALVKTHHYAKAINYYEAALHSGGQSFLRYDLAELHLKLKQYDKAQRALEVVLEQKQSDDLIHLMDQVRFLILLARVHHQAGDSGQAIRSLSSARDVQASVLGRTGVEQPEEVSNQNTLMANICCQMADHSVSARQFENAVLLYKEALSHKQTDEKAMLALAKLHLSLNDLNSCQQQCLALLRLNKDNDAATVMMADLMFRKNEYDSAIFHFQQLLERRPDHYEALVRLIGLLRKAGHLEECSTFIKQAEEASPRSAADPGLYYCKGLVDWYQNNPNGALKNFNLARKDTEWGESATINMIEICLNPDSETIGGETFESVDTDSNEKQDSEIAAVRTAEKLLKELKPKPGSQKLTILTSFTLLATKSKLNVENALSQFVGIVAEEHESVPALYGMAVAYMVLRQTPRARNQLKRINKKAWNSMEAEEFEKSWLLLADIYIQSGKYDLATDLLKRCLLYNKSCWKANEYLGFIMEKEQSYRDAAISYENAWKFGNQKNPAIGYKLAFNYLKAKRFVDAIDVCHKVLILHPAYPKIRREILEKARSSVRV